jgi:serine/threonine protein kinase
MLGQGGMGTVFLAEDVQLRRKVALKVMRPDVARKKAARERFLREARAVAALDHDHIVAIFQVGEDNGVPFLTMPLLNGETLETRLTREGCLPVDELVRIGRETAEGLAAAHAAGLIHRDIKPANLWLEPRPNDPPKEPRVKILDFGLARPQEPDENLTEEGMALGTPAYMSPEQVNAGPLDCRADVFSLGCVMYQLATGKRPFVGNGVGAILAAVASHQPDPPHAIRAEIPHSLSDLIMAMLVKNPQERPASAEAVLVGLQVISAGNTLPEVTYPLAPARAETTTEALSAPTRSSRRKWLTFAGILAVVGLALLLWQPWKASSITNPDARSEDAPYKGAVDLLIWTRDGKDIRKLRLTDAETLPLRPGDQIRIVAEVEPAAYLYLFWIDTEGKAAPIYPWKPGQWDTRPQKEDPRHRLELPERATKGYTISGDQAGMETLLLLARPTPLPPGDADIKRALSGLLPQRPVQNPRSAVWFENGDVIRSDANRRALNFTAEEINDPVLRMQNLLREPMRPLAPYTTAVSFAKTK